MPLNDFSPAKDKTTERFRRLQELYRKHCVLPWPEFRCEFFPSCNPAFARLNKGDIPEKSRGCAAYLGDCYDLVEKSSGAEIRITIIGIDHGDCAVDIVERRNRILGKDSDGNWNPHMRGVRKILGALLEDDPTDEVFRYYAMPNALKCGGCSMRWNRPNMMFENCIPYLSEELSVLEPNVVLTQSHGQCFEPLKRYLEKQKAKWDLLEEHKYASLYQMRYKRDDNGWAEAYLVDSPHPAYPRGFYSFFLPLFQEKLAPLIRQRLRSTG